MESEPRATYVRRQLATVGVFLVADVGLWSTCRLLSKRYLAAGWLWDPAIIVNLMLKWPPGVPTMTYALVGGILGGLAVRRGRSGTVVWALTSSIALSYVAYASFYIYQSTR